MEKLPKGEKSNFFSPHSLMNCSRLITLKADFFLPLHLKRNNVLGKVVCSYQYHIVSPNWISEGTPYIPSSKHWSNKLAHLLVISLLYDQRSVMYPLLFILTGWEGFNCEEDIDECATNPCRNGICIQNEPGLGYTCYCKPGFVVWISAIFPCWN